MSRHSKPLYPPLPKLNSSDFKWSTHRPCPPPMQIADPSMTATNVPDTEHRSPEVRPRQKLTNGRVMRRKAQLVCDFFLVGQAFKQWMHRPLCAFRLPLTCKAMAYFLSICLHLLHLCLRMDWMEPTAQCNCSWEDFPSVDADGAWIDWVSCLFDHSGFV